MVVTSAQTLVAFYSLIVACRAAKLPDDFTRCHVNDVDFAKCLGPAVEGALHKLQDGILSIGVPSLNPLLVEEMTLDLGSGPVALIINGKNISVNGISNSVVSSAEMDVKGYKMTVRAHTPHLRLDFTYSASGRILLVAVQGDGPAFIELMEVDTTHILSGEPYEKKGKLFWNVTDYSVDIAPKKMITRFDNLLKGDPRVSDQINGFLNTEWKPFFQQIKPPAQEAFGSIFQLIANRLFSRVPFREIFLES